MRRRLADGRNLWLFGHGIEVLRASRAQRQTNMEFADLLNQLIVSSPGDPKRSEVLVARTLERKQATEWRWLLEKAKALKTKEKGPPLK